MDVGCTGTCVPIEWDELFEVLRMLATQVLLCLPIGWVEVLEVLQMLDAQVLVYLSVGLKCWGSQVPVQPTCLKGRWYEHTVC